MKLTPHLHKGGVFRVPCNMGESMTKGAKTTPLKSELWVLLPYSINFTALCYEMRAQVELLRENCLLCKPKRTIQFNLIFCFCFLFLIQKNARLIFWIEQS
jgi:hypothetical protein